MDEDRYVVISLDLESDDPGIDTVWGIFNADEAQDFAYTKVRNSMGLRGITLHVAMVRSDPHDV